MGPAESIVPLIDAAGLEVERVPGHGVLRLPNAVLALTDGRSATERCAEEEHAGLVLFDLALDYAATPRIVLAAAEQSFAVSQKEAAGLVHAIDKQASFINDVAGMVVMRTVSMLINEAAEAISHGVLQRRGSRRGDETRRQLPTRPTGMGGHDWTRLDTAGFGQLECVLRGGSLPRFIAAAPPRGRRQKT